MVPNPLRVLFCGSDIFSIYSLQKLYRLKQLDPNYIQSLQVVSRPPKWGGKNKSILRKPRILQDIESLENMPPAILCDNKPELIDKILPLIQRNEFNMLICVSFGLLIPQQLIQSIPYTLNLHPSLLPRYMGSSPIQYALLNNDAYTGATVQTLHPTKFDRGDIIAQSKEYNIEMLLNEETGGVGLPGSYTSKLTNKLGDIGSDLLVNVIRQGTYLAQSNLPSKYPPSVAPRIQTLDKLAKWQGYDASQLYRRLMTLGPLYSFINCDGTDKRVIFHSFTINKHSIKTINVKPGSFQLYCGNQILRVYCANGTSIDVTAIQIAGSTVGSPRQFLADWQRQCPIRNDSKHEFIS